MSVCLSLSLFCTDVKLLRRRARFLRSKNKLNLRVVVVVVVALALGKKGHTLLPLPVCMYICMYLCLVCIFVCCFDIFDHCVLSQN